MTELNDKVKALNRLIISGETISAMELFYSEDVEMQENDESPRKGKIVCIDAEKNNLKKVKNIESTLLNQAIDKDKNVVFSEWKILCTYKDDSKFLLTQVSVQYWSDGYIAKEKFYYKGFREIK